MRTSIKIFFVLVAISISGISCKKKTTSSGVNTILIRGMSYSPSSITISKGTTLEWVNKDEVNHSVTSDKPGFDSGTLSREQTFRNTFTMTGVFNYHCTFHTGMRGTVTVE